MRMRLVSTARLQSWLQYEVLEWIIKVMKAVCIAYLWLRAIKMTTLFYIIFMLAVCIWQKHSGKTSFIAGSKLSCCQCYYCNFIIKLHKLLFIFWDIQLKARFAQEARSHWHALWQLYITQHQLLHFWSGSCRNNSHLLEPLIATECQRCHFN